MTTVITYGTFDLLHIGHLRLLERSKNLGDRLVVGVSTDEFNAQKGKAALVPYRARRDLVAALKVVDEVIPEKDWDQKVHDIKRYGASVFCIGSDWQGKFDHLSSVVRVVYIPRTRGVDSTQLRAISRQADRRVVEKLIEAQHSLGRVIAELS